MSSSESEASLDLFIAENNSLGSKMWLCFLIHCLFIISNSKYNWFLFKSFFGVLFIYHINGNDENDFLPSFLHVTHCCLPSVHQRCCSWSSVSGLSSDFHCQCAANYSLLHCPLHLLTLQLTAHLQISKLQLPLIKVNMLDFTLSP